MRKDGGGFSEEHLSVLARICSSASYVLEDSIPPSERRALHELSDLGFFGKISVSHPDRPLDTMCAYFISEIGQIYYARILDLAAEEFSRQSYGKNESQYSF